MFEVELKYPVESHDSIRQKLAEMDSTHLGVSDHCDEYFNQTLLDFAGNDIALRIRSRGDRHTLTFKGPNLDTRAKIREEIELDINTEDKEKLRGMLLGMGFHDVTKVNKHRDSISVRWQQREAQICLDTIEGIGTFVELEQVVEDRSQVDAAKATLEALAIELAICAEPTTVSYLEMLLAKE